MNSKEALIDSHCHLNTIDLTDFDGDFKQLLKSAADAGVSHMLCVSVELADTQVLRLLADQYKQIYISSGIHPNVILDQPIVAQDIIDWATHPACIAIGETGLDYYRTEESLAQKAQQARFREHIIASKQTSKPLIIHTRQAAEDTLGIMREMGVAETGGVMHCFSESWEIAKQALDLNFYISFSGILTFKSAIELQEIAKKVPLDRILIETDSPYLAPVPFRGKQNHPALVRHVALALSELRQMDYSTIARQTTKNFFQCFRCEERT